MVNGLHYTSTRAGTPTMSHIDGANQELCTHIVHLRYVNFYFTATVHVRVQWHTVL